MPAKQLVLFTDRQGASWPTQSLGEQWKQLPSPMQVVEVTAEDMENAWVADFKLRDGVADLQAPAVFVATIGYEGRSPRRDVQVTLTVDGVAIAAQTVDLQPGQRREIRFPPYHFDVPVEPGKPTFVTAEVSISPDRLPADDQRFLVVPVLTAVPVVFVDQWGRDEAPRLNRYGETFYLRRLLSPVTSRAQRERRLIDVRHVKIDELKRELLEDARLVVVAGVSGPARGRAAVARVRRARRQFGDRGRGRVRPAVVDRGRVARRRRDPAGPARPHARWPPARRILRGRKAVPDRL